MPVISVYYTTESGLDKKLKEITQHCKKSKSELIRTLIEKKHASVSKRQKK